MPSRIPARGICINGHQTSVRLAPQFWYWLRVIAAEVGTSAMKLIEGIEIIAKSQQQGLSSAIRVYVCAYFCGAEPHLLIDPTSKLAVRVEPPGKVKFDGKRYRRRAEGILEAMSKQAPLTRRPRAHRSPTRS